MIGESGGGQQGQYGVGSYRPRPRIAACLTLQCNGDAGRPGQGQLTRRRAAPRRWRSAQVSVPGAGTRLHKAD